MKKTISILLVCLTATTGFSQTLEELFNLAETNNRKITISQDALATAKESLEHTKAQRLPDISAALSLGYNGRGLITDRDFSNAMNIYIPEFANNFSLQATQVLYAGGAINNSIKLSEMGQRMAELDVERNRQEVRFYIAGQYLDMLKTLNTVKVVEQNITLTEQLLAEMRARVSQGTALKNDITRYELQLETLKLQLRRLTDTQTILNHNLCLTLNLPEGTEIHPTTNPLTQAPQPSKGGAKEGAANSSRSGDWGGVSPILKQAALAVDIAEKKTQLAKAQFLPKLALVAEDHLCGPVTIEIPALNKNFNYWFLGIGVQYNLSSLYKGKHDLRRARLEYSEATDKLALAHEETNKAVNAATVELTTAQSELQTCEKQVQLANENYSVISNRYANGLSLLTDLLDASNMKLSAETALEQAKINILFCQKKLLYLTGSL